MLVRLKHYAAQLRHDVRIYRRVLTHPRTPRAAKLLLGLAIAYLCMPFDLIPDFIPVIGHIDDLLIVPGLVALALWLIPPEIIMECRRMETESATVSAPGPVSCEDATEGETQP